MKILLIVLLTAVTVIGADPAWAEPEIRVAGCSRTDTSDCIPDDGLRRMVECENNTAGDNDLILAWAGGYTVTCANYFHIYREHLPVDVSMADRLNLRKCIGLALSGRGRDWSGAKPPNTGYAFHNDRSGVWGYVSTAPDRTINTAFTSGSGRDWGGCVRGYG